MSNAPRPSRFNVGDRMPGTKYVLVRLIDSDDTASLLEVVKNPGIKGAMRVLNADLAKRSDSCQRFFEEARILAQLKHRNLVQLIDYDQLLNGNPYYVMELLVGKTLRQLLRDAGKVEPPVAFEIQHQLLEGLHRAHATEPRNVHGDIKPENIYLHVPELDAPCVKILGFGKQREPSREKSGRTLFAPKYMAPEQITGQSFTPKTDLYAAGLVLYEMLCGRGPFDDLVSAERVMEAHVKAPAPSIRAFAPWVPESIDRLLQSALAKRPSDRPADAYAFAAQLFDLQFLGEAELGRDSEKTADSTATWGVVAETPASDPPPPPDDLDNDPTIQVHWEALPGVTGEPLPPQGALGDADPGWARANPPSPQRAAHPPYQRAWIAGLIALLLLALGAASVVASRTMTPKDLSEHTAGSADVLFERARIGPSTKHD
jgi:serine/threonine-protein kinase